MVGLKYENNGTFGILYFKKNTLIKKVDIPDIAGDMKMYAKENQPNIESLSLLYHNNIFSF